MGTEDNLKVARRFREALWTSADPEVLEGIIAPGCKFHARAPFETGFESGQIVMRHLVAFYRLTFSDIDMTVEQTVAQGDLVTLLWSARAKHTGDLLGTKPTGRLVRTGGIDLVRIEDGRIAECWLMWDDLGLLTQILGPKDERSPMNPDLLTLIERLLE